MRAWPAFWKCTGVEVVSANPGFCTKSGGWIGAFVLERIGEEEQR